MGLIADGPMFLAKPRLTVAANFTVPPYSDLRPYLTDVEDQGTRPICVAEAVKEWIQVDGWCRHHVPPDVDAERIYAEAKRIDDAPESEGTTLEAGMQAAQNLGYIPRDCTVKTIRTALEMQFALHTRTPVISAFDITAGWEPENVSRKNGFIGNQAAQRGGHAVLTCWYALAGVETDDSPESYGWRNSWGTPWGLNGLGRMTRAQFDRQHMYSCVIERSGA
jgi:hypothetical protein